MVKRNIKKLLLVLLLTPTLIGCSSNTSSSSSSNEQISTSSNERSIQKLVVDDSKVKTNYYINEKLDLSSLKVYLKTFKNNAWDEGKEILDYTSSLPNGKSLDQVGEYEVKISYQEFTPYSFYINVIDNTSYLDVSSFSKGIVTFTKDGKTEDLNMNSITKNTPHTSCLDPLGKNNKILVVPYYFSEDKDLANEESRKVLEDVFFGDSKVAEEHNMPYTVKTYYETSSYGKTTFEGDVISWLPSSYGSSENITDGGMDAAKDIKDIYLKEYAKVSHGLLGENAKPWSYYDGNKDGMIDCLWIIYSKDMEHVATNQWWAYTTHTTTNDKVNYNVPVIKTMCWASYAFMHGNYDPHTYVHETGHAYGLVDYYDYHKAWSPMGGIDMMDNNVGDHNAFSKFSLGWATPYVVDKSAIISLHPFTTSGESILLPSKGFNGTAFDEYLLLQFDAPVGLNAKDYVIGNGSMTGYTRPGVRLMHIDARVYKDDKNILLKDNVEEGIAFSYDNSHFGRFSDGTSSRCATDYFEGNNNPSNLDRSYALANLIPASYDKERNIQTQMMYADNSSLFREGTRFSLDEEYYDFLPSYSSLWDKARTKEVNGDEVKVSIDKTYKINYEFEVLEITSNEARILIDVKGE